jgi:type IV secretory pathway component VirB8
VLAASVVVLGALAFVLVKMIPLERPEVFFLVNATRSVNVVIEPFNPDTSAAINYEKGFVREYVIARNTLDVNPTITKNNWKNIVKSWSDNGIYKKFTNTKLYKNYMFGMQPSKVTCSVNFDNLDNAQAVIRTGSGNYTVNFTWICKNIGGQTTSKNYKIKIKVQSELDKNVSGTFENLEKLKVNPLGIQVTEYDVQGDADPLNSDVLY